MEYRGNDLKYVFTSNGEFNFTSMEWDMIFSINEKKVTMKKRNVTDGFVCSCDAPNMGFKPLSDGRWIFLIDSSYFDAGWLIATLYAYIPDADFDPTDNFETLDGIRREVRRFSLEPISRL